MSTDEPPRTSGSFKWWICFLLLLATTLNYMDRQALSQTGVRIKAHFSLTNSEFGLLEGAFNAAFAIGAIGIGWLVDRGNLRLIYPLIVVAWSLAGFAAGYASSFMFLMLCRFALGLFEAGNWPCGILTVKRVLKPAERTLGNGMFQSGTALGAIIMPLVVNACLMYADPRGETDDPAFAWQLPFRVVGAAGILWAVLWLVSVRAHHVRPAQAPDAAPGGHDSYWAIWKDRRFWALAVVVVGVNVPWRSFGFWLATFLREAKGYEEKAANYLSSAFFAGADAGSFAVGFVVLFLVRQGLRLHSARLWCFGCCCLLTMLSAVAIILPAGWTLIVVLLGIGFGSLGMFPVYFALSQEISSRHQGKVTGTLSLINSVSMAMLMPVQGKLIDATGSFLPALGLAGFTPVLALVAILVLWREPRKNDQPSSPA